MPEYGDNSYFSSLKGFLAMHWDDWIVTMIENYPGPDDTPSKSQIDAWTDEFFVLQEAFCDYESPGDLDIIFEYVIPQNRPGTRKFEEGHYILSDAILLSENTVIVLEFKRRFDVYEGHISQTAKYVRRLSNYHNHAHYMDVYGILVLTRCFDYNEDWLDRDGTPVTVVSRDNLRKAVERKLLEDDAGAYEITEEWLFAGFSVQTDDYEEDTEDGDELEEDYAPEDDDESDEDYAPEDDDDLEEDDDPDELLGDVWVYHATFGTGVVIGSTQGRMHIATTNGHWCGAKRPRCGAAAGCPEVLK